MIEITAWAPTREAGIAFMQAVGIAKHEPERVETHPGFWTWTETIDVGDGPEVTQTSGPELPPGKTGTWTDGYTETIPERLTPLVNVQFSRQGDDGWDIPDVPGWHVNVRYYGSSADALMQGGDPSSPDLFERAPGLLAITELRTGEPMQWVALSNDPVPPGYENSNGVRLYDPALIATRANIWA